MSSGGRREKKHEKNDIKKSFLTKILLTDHEEQRIKDDVDQSSSDEENFLSNRIIGDGVAQMTGVRQSQQIHSSTDRVTSLPVWGQSTGDDFYDYPQKPDKYSHAALNDRINRKLPIGDGYTDVGSIRANIQTNRSVGTGGAFCDHTRGVAQMAELDTLNGLEKLGVKHSQPLSMNFVPASIVNPQRDPKYRRHDPQANMFSVSTFGLDGRIVLAPKDLREAMRNVVVERAIVWRVYQDLIVLTPISQWHQTASEPWLIALRDITYIEGFFKRRHETQFYANFKSCNVNFNDHIFPGDLAEVTIGRSAFLDDLNILCYAVVAVRNYLTNHIDRSFSPKISALYNHGELYPAIVSAIYCQRIQSDGAADEILYYAELTIIDTGAKVLASGRSMVNDEFMHQLGFATDENELRKIALFGVDKRQPKFVGKCSLSRIDTLGGAAAQIIRRHPLEPQPLYSKKRKGNHAVVDSTQTMFDIHLEQNMPVYVSCLNKKYLRMRDLPPITNDENNGMKGIPPYDLLALRIVSTKFIREDENKFRESEHIIEGIGKCTTILHNRAILYDHERKIGVEIAMREHLKLLHVNQFYTYRATFNFKNQSCEYRAMQLVEQGQAIDFNQHDISEYITELMPITPDKTINLSTTFNLLELDDEALEDDYIEGFFSGSTIPPSSIKAINSLSNPTSSGRNQDLSTLPEIKYTVDDLLFRDLFNEKNARDECCDVTDYNFGEPLYGEVTPSSEENAMTPVKNLSPISNHASAVSLQQQSSIKNSQQKEVDELFVKWMLED